MDHEPDLKPAQNLITRAYQALKSGERPEARRLAVMASRLAPDVEDSWLILAALGTPDESLKYLRRALDINPYLNPVIYSDGRIEPPGAVYRPGAPGTFFPEHPLLEEFRKRGWTWGGNFITLKDNHHFDKEN